MFPLDRARFPETKGRYSPALVRSVYALLVGGLAPRAAVEPIQGDRTGGPLGALLVAAAVAQALGILLFLAAIWARVRAVTTP